MAGCAVETRDKLNSAVLQIFTERENIVIELQIIDLAQIRASSWKLVCKLSCGRLRLIIANFIARLNTAAQFCLINLI